jgi:hypothetical protein
MTTQEKSEGGGNGHEPVYYGSARLCGFGRWTPEDMRRILTVYDLLVQGRKYTEVIDREKIDGAPETWLDWILSSNHLLREDIMRTTNSQGIKGGEAKS